MRLPAILATATATAAALALPGAAVAKEVTALDVCGTDGCTRIADRATLRGFEQGSELAQAPPAGAQRSYLVRVRVRDDTDAARVGWETLWLPAAGVMAFDDGQPGATFTPVGPTLERALRHAARGHRARAARTFSAPAPPTARVVEVVPSPAPAAAESGSSHRPALAGVGLAAILVLIGAGAWRARRS
jgi:hypothetical protein